MEKSVSQSPFEKIGFPLNQTLPWIIFILGLWLVVIKPFGPHWEFVLGDLGDARFNNYILEHFFRWISGAEPSYWNAPFFYPYENVIAFSDNLLGSAIFYSGLRWAGFDRETAFQGWYVLSFCFNYLAAAYVLSRFKFQPLATSIGAFFFTFGIPLLAQETHPQLFYRFGIPLACFFLWRFFEKPQLNGLAAIVFWLVWQFYLSIYLGFFLVLLLATLAILAPIFEAGLSIGKYLRQWPLRFNQAWFQTNSRGRAFSLFVICGAILCLLALLWPYYKVSADYGFSRDWVTVSAMLPLPQSYLLADNSPLWRNISLFFGGVSMRHEHQMFPGLAISMLMAIGIAIRYNSKNKLAAWLYFWAVIILVIVTLNFNGISIYWLIWNIPGINSIRAVTRIELVLMWPLAFFAAWAMDGITQLAQQKTFWLDAAALLLTGLLIAESAYFPQTSYPKAEGLLYLMSLKQRIPAILPKNPILSVAYTGNEPDYVAEIDAMLVAQDLGWPTLNGYSGNFPQGYNLATKCEQIPNQIKKYFKAVSMNKEKRLAYYLFTMKRIVPIGFQDCDPSWWKNMP